MSISRDREKVNSCIDCKLKLINKVNGELIYYEGKIIEIEFLLYTSETKTKKLENEYGKEYLKLLEEQLHNLKRLVRILEKSLELLYIGVK